MVLIDKKSQMEVERNVLCKKKNTGTINRWIREYIQEGEDNCFKRKNKYEINYDLLIPLVQYYYDLSNGTAGYRQIKDQIEEHTGIVISYYMAYILKYRIMKLPAVRELSKNKEKYRVTINNSEDKFTYQNL